MVDKDVTIIVGRNNSAKTSCMAILDKVINGKGAMSINDYPLSKRKELYKRLADFLDGVITYEEMVKQIPIIAVEFTIDYASEKEDEELGNLSPFIIDLDTSTTKVLIRAEFALAMKEKAIRGSFPKYSPDSKDKLKQIKDFCKNKFSSLFALSVSAINPKDHKSKLKKDVKDLKKLFRFHPIYAERALGESFEDKNDSLAALVNDFFKVEEIEYGDPGDVYKTLRDRIQTINLDLQNKSDEALSQFVADVVKFGYPREDELELGVETELAIDDKFANSTKLTYKYKGQEEMLPGNYNGLGFRNLIKIALEITYFIRQVVAENQVCIPIIFLEEPESHMHPQMQSIFIQFLGDYLSKHLDGNSIGQIQSIITSHSPHIANSADFRQIRYAQRSKSNIIYKNLTDFLKGDVEKTADFVKKYLNISRCDLFFADKVILVEGASERLLIPDMINKMSKKGDFKSKMPDLASQYYSLIEVGGAYAHLFIPIIKFLGIPCLIITDLDPIGKDSKRSYVKDGCTTSNKAIKYWIKNMAEDSKNETTDVSIQGILALSPDKKTKDNIHIEYQVSENELCGRSLEESIINVNRARYKLNNGIDEQALSSYTGSKTDFAIDLATGDTEYNIPKYIRDGLLWLNNQEEHFEERQDDKGKTENGSGTRS